jgi:surfactin synthase thioesterase subunit
MHLAKDPTTSGSGSASTGSLSSLSGEELVGAIAKKLQSGLAKIVGLEAARISVSEKIDQYAFDSLTLTQIRGLILREFRVAYAVMRLFQGPSLHEIAVDVAGSMAKGASGHQGHGGAPNGTDKPSGNAVTTLPSRLHAVSKWLVTGKKPLSKSSPKLVCFHPMGTGASFFSPFLIEPPEGFAPIAIQLPGRENRSAEPIYTRMSDLVEDVVAELDGCDVGPQDIFWGHSFGGIIAFEVLRGLRRKSGKPLPRLMVTGTIAPQLIRHWQRRDVLLHVLTEDPNLEYMFATSRYVDDADFTRSILPGMKKDAPLLLGYRYDETEAPLDVPVTAFAARQDEFVYPDEVGAWRVHEKDFKLIEVDGDHWFLNRNRKLLSKALASTTEVDA